MLHVRDFSSAVVSAATILTCSPKHITCILSMRDAAIFALLLWFYQRFGSLPVAANEARQILRKIIAEYHAGKAFLRAEERNW